MSNTKLDCIPKYVVAYHFIIIELNVYTCKNCKVMHIEKNDRNFSYKMKGHWLDAVKKEKT